ncbi:MAG TPA: VOC family protein [Chitinophagaceae bacterium]|nr:VOC family protein [Chitinophagaceae bacterium]
MTRVTGIGGIFLKSKDPKAMTEWYQRHLGIEFNDNSYFSFQWVNPHHPTLPGSTVFSFFKETSDYFQPSEKMTMINFRVQDLRALLTELEKEGVKIVGEMQEYPYGKFGWIMDPEDNKIELWEPIDDGF